MPPAGCEQIAMAIVWRCACRAATLLTLVRCRQVMIGLPPAAGPAAVTLTARLAILLWLRGGGGGAESGTVDLPLETIAAAHDPPLHAGWVKRPTKLTFVSRWCEVLPEPARLCFFVDREATKSKGELALTGSTFECAADCV
eukprot:5757264-Prymnesium_polylepis.1